MSEVVTEKDYSIQRMWLLKDISITIFLILVTLVLIVFGKNNGEYVIPLIILSLILLVVAPAAPLRRITFHYSISDKFLTLRQGILSKQEKNIPYGVIQNIFIKQDLFDRIFGLASLVVENASYGAGVDSLTETEEKQRVELIGFRGNKVSIPGLKKTDAETLKDILLQKIEKNPIEDSQSGL